MKKSRYSLVFAVLLFGLSGGVSADPVWQSNSAFLLHGSGYEVDTDEQSTLTLEHVSGWSFGDLFAFVDLTQYHGSDQGDGVYGEFSPRLSLGKISEKDLSIGFIKDILLASTFEFGKGDVESFLIGPGFDLALPGFNYFQLNIFHRFTKNNRDGETIQITPVWGMNFPLGDSTLIFEGYIDWNVNSDDSYQSNIHVNPRLKYDLEKILHLPSGKSMLGVEYSYWKNKYGIKDSSAFDTDQSALSLFFSYQF
ncbi:MAG: hypothetical protein KZQ83_20720 [gamma proteobacterium symbiont of Taylorina sp.]|nr:hypothetical protein [gamma proteobacterium symbiont of Taylorina sp.]